MNIFNKVTLQSLKKNRTRTIVTIIGIILSAAMICAVTTFASSIYNFMYEATVWSEGEWHGSEKGLQYEAMGEIMKSKEVDSYVYNQQIGYAIANGCANEFKPYIYVIGASEDFEALMPIHISLGKYPTSQNEILLPEHLYSNGDVKYELGDTITLELGKRMLDGYELHQNNPCYIYEEMEEVFNGEELQINETRTYKVVGFYERPGFEEYTAPGYTAITIADEEISGEYLYDIYFKMDKAGTVYDYMAKNRLTGNTNDDVLMYLGVASFDGFSVMLYGLCAIVIGLIMFGSVSLIYNAFSISVSERTKQFGLLSSIGATKKQLKKMVLFEALAVSAVGIPIGIISGVAGIGVTLALIGDKFTEMGAPVEMKLSVSVISIIIAIVIALVTVLISAWIPSKRATKVTAVEAIRQNVDINTKGKDVKTSKLAYKLFGLPGMLANKYYKRNRKKYRATVLSLFMSIVLFVSASAFTDYLMRSVEVGFGTDMYDITFLTEKEDLEEITLDGLLDELKDADAVNQASYTYEFMVIGNISKDYINDKAMENMLTSGNPSADTDENVETIISILCFVNDEEFVKLLAEYKLDEEEYMNPDEPLAIAVDGNSTFDVKKEKYVTLKLLNSDKAVVNCYENEIEGGAEYSVKSGKTIYECPFYLTDSQAHLSFIYPFSMLDEVLPENVREYYDYITYQYFFTSDEHEKSYDAIEELLVDKGLSTDTLVDYQKVVESNRNVVAIIQVFSYGFIVLISLIAAANVFNTISTNISLRRREFAMLKSVGMTEKGFNKMMNYECLLYGSRALLYGLPVSVAVTFLIFLAVSAGYESAFVLPWSAIGIAVFSVFAVVFSTMLYSMGKIKADNTIEALKNENV